MSDLGARLREERERLRMTQTDLAVRGGVQKNSQIKYEKGDRTPDAAYLAALADAGLDVLYVLTGQRGPGRSGQAAAPSYALLAQCVHAAAAALSARGLVVDEDQAGRLYWSLYLSCLPQGAFNAALVDPLVNMIPSQQP